ncbi:set and mynd domain-containing protein [Aspergillus ellipticus CBS 707.79]|uniref:Set and mynd domain-containing protein n=1 Tax=Aspergillus ellipticus CBS 707.79 TaxID=1448320 RepID=A0A319DHF5_9EURO|nr:set and mynd domain-containing protein [Aspergillus ellipticus CBS 707.79]
MNASPESQSQLQSPALSSSDGSTVAAEPWVHPHLEQGVVPIKGRQLRASRCISKGELLMVDVPFAVIPAVDYPDISDGLLCSNPACGVQTLYQYRVNCPAGCLDDVVWCDEECRDGDALRHGFECVWLKRFGASIRKKWGEYDFGMLWLIVRVLAMRRVEGEGEGEGQVGERFKGGWEAIQDFCGSTESWSHSQVRAWTALAKRYLRGSAALPHNLSDEEVVALICREEANSFGLYPRETGVFPVPDPPVDRGEQYAAAVYPRAAIANHSCSPNIMHKPDDHGRMVFTASRDIAAGEECCISYFDLSQCVELRARRDHLQKLFRFVCRCDRCTTEEAAEEQQQEEWVGMPFGEGL